MSTVQLPQSSRSPVRRSQEVRQQEVRNINIRKVPESVWQHARQQALAADQSFKVWLINLLAGCQPCLKTQAPTPSRPWRPGQSMSETSRKRSGTEPRPMQSLLACLCGTSSLRYLPPALLWTLQRPNHFGPLLRWATRPQPRC